MLDKIIKEQANFIKIAGFLATIIGIISFLPVVFIVYTTKKTNNFSYTTLLLALISNLLWIYYSFHSYPKIDLQIIFMGSLYFFIYTFILYTKILY